jgi:hypothetical protein
MEDDCWSILALENETSLAASIGLRAAMIATIVETIRMFGELD